jgi:RNA-binding protein
LLECDFAICLYCRDDSPIARRRSELRGEAHKLSPIVIIGDKGLTDEVIAEIDRSLKAHELIKVRAAGGERDAREIWLDTICTRLAAHAVQQIGKGVRHLSRESAGRAAETVPPLAEGRRRSEERLARGAGSSAPGRGKKRR